MHLESVSMLKSHAINKLQLLEEDQMTQISYTCFKSNLSK